MPLPIPPLPDLLSQIKQAILESEARTRAVVLLSVGVTGLVLIGLLLALTSVLLTH